MLVPDLLCRDVASLRHIGMLRMTSSVLNQHLASGPHWAKATQSLAPPWLRDQLKGVLCAQSAMRIVGQLSKIDRQLREIETTKPLAVFAPRGSGKTTLVRTIADALGAAGRKVCIVDGGELPALDADAILVDEPAYMDLDLFLTLGRLAHTKLIFFIGTQVADELNIFSRMRRLRNAQGEAVFHVVFK